MNIRRKLTILMLIIGLVPLVVVGVIAYATISSEITNRAASQLSSIAIKQEQKLNALLQGKQEEVINLSNRYDLQVAIGTYLNTGSQADHDAVTTLIRDKKAQVTGLDAIHITDLQHQIIASTQTSSEGQTFENKPYRTDTPQKSVITIREDSDGINKLFITTNLNVNKKESAILNMVFRIDDIVAAVQDYTGLGDTGETVVAARDQNDNAISQFPLRFDTEAALHTNLNDLMLFNRGETTRSNLVDYRGHHVMLATSYTGFADWVVAAKIDRSEALAPIDQLRNVLVVILVVSSIAIIIGAFWLARFFTRPILRIATIAQKIGQGDLSARVGLQRNDELGTLGTSIDSMGANLKGFVNRIESARNRLEVILNSTTESILAIDKRGTIIIANRAATELTQLPIDQIVGKNFNQLFAWTRELQPFRIDYNTSGTNVYPDLQYTNRAGNVHYVKLITAPVNDELDEQQSAQLIITIHDETKSRELENMKVDFVSMAAHELRTPLAAIRGYLELITYKDKQRGKDPESDMYLQQALASTSELGGLINNLLGVTRIERGTLTFSPEKLDLAVHVNQAVKDAAFSANDKRIELTYNGPPSGCFVRADQIAIHEVINNLLGNAIKYTEPRGHVEVSLRQEGNKYEVSIKDTGIGIPKQALPNLFTKFYRVHGGLNSGSTGTGLGLFIAKSIIERHNGSIHVESQEGMGSVFSFMLPALEQSTAPVTASGKKPDTISSTRGHRGWVTKNITR